MRSQISILADVPVRPPSYPRFRVLVIWPSLLGRGFGLSSNDTSDKPPGLITLGLLTGLQRVAHCSHSAESCASTNTLLGVHY